MCRCTFLMILAMAFCLAVLVKTDVFKFKLPVNKNNVKKVISLLTSPRVRQSDESFSVTTETVPDNKIKAYVGILYDQLDDQGLKDFVQRIPITDNGQ